MKNDKYIPTPSKIRYLTTIVGGDGLERMNPKGAGRVEQIRFDHITI